MGLQSYVAGEKERWGVGLGFPKMLTKTKPDIGQGYEGAERLRNVSLQLGALLTNQASMFMLH